MAKYRVSQEYIGPLILEKRQFTLHSLLWDTLYVGDVKILYLLSPEAYISTVFGKFCYGIIYQSLGEVYWFAKNSKNNFLKNFHN